MNQFVIDVNEALYHMTLLRRMDWHCSLCLTVDPGGFVYLLDAHCVFVCLLIVDIVC